MQKAKKRKTLFFRIFGHFYRLLIFGLSLFYAWHSMAMNGHVWPCMATHGHSWPSMAMHGHAMPCMAMKRCTGFPPSGKPVLQNNRTVFNSYKTGFVAPCQTGLEKTGFDETGFTQNWFSACRVVNRFGCRFTVRFAVIMLFSPGIHGLSPPSPRGRGVGL